MTTQVCRETQWLEHNACGAGNEAGKSKQRPDLIKILCHPEKFILDVVSIEMLNLHHDDLSHFWPSLELSLHVSLI